MNTPKTILLVDDDKSFIESNKDLQYFKYIFLLINACLGELKITS